MPDFATFNYGGSRFPLATSTSQTLLQDADPVIFWSLDYFASVLAIHLGARWAAEVTAIGGTFAQQYGTSIVAYTTPIDPVPYLLEEQFKFPLFAIYPVDDEISRRTINWSHDVTTLGVAFILPPLTAGQAEKLVPILRAVPRVLANRAEQGFDPAYRNGAKVWSSAFAGLEEIDWPKKGKYGAFPGINDEMFPAWTGSIVVKERQMRETDFSKFTATDTALDLAAPSDPTAIDPTQSIKDFVDFKSDVKPPGPNG